MTGKYLQILKESLENKLQILTEIEELSKEQTKLIENDESFEEIDKNMDKKVELINRINTMDEGFQALYDNIKKEVEGNKDKYGSQIAELQDKIRDVMAKSTSIEAIEARNKKSMEQRFTTARKDGRQKLSHAAAVQDYYKVANKLNAIVPQFMDKKK